MNEWVDIAFRLQIARRMARMTQAQAAERIGIARPTLTMWETGKARPSLEKFGRLVTIYDADANWILTGMSRAELVSSRAATHLAEKNSTLP